LFAGAAAIANPAKKNTVIEFTTTTHLSIFIFSVAVNARSFTSFRMTPR